MSDSHLVLPHHTSYLYITRSIKNLTIENTAFVSRYIRLLKNYKNKNAITFII